ncbi:lamin tail domain-containing protein [Mongoliitalea daihaiensis]|uniref:lamin tail domain-containing protein n=1 Tax=Mongoliitalea daihaiensis TaxID=2782006 RepID=UPI001F1B5B58|nr:lamin tail domain-containing protein [Mongoliitalea daihaiensis]UJP65555.1 lamin tail domain-containing protein [Mongoliitalea daihaiensis]
MMWYVRKCIYVCLLICALNGTSHGQIQNFESPFRIVSAPEEFLPNWSANEVRGTAARVFQANGQGRNGSRALAVQPISGFNGQIFIRLDLTSYELPKLAFFARTGVNGTGNRAVEMFMAFSLNGGDSFDDRLQIGTSNTFPNALTSFRLFEVSVPEKYHGASEVFVRIEVNVGLGTGSAARFFMDDFGVFEMDEEVNPLQVTQARLLSPYQFLLEFDRPFILPVSDQVMPEGWSILQMVQQRERFLLLEIGQGLNLDRYALELVDMKDADGLVTGLINVEVDNGQAVLGDAWILSSTRLRLLFSQPFEPSSIVQTSIFSIAGQQPLAIDLLESGYAVDITLTQALSLGELIPVQVGPFRNSAGVTTANSQLSVMYQPTIVDLLVVDDKTIELYSNEPLTSFVGEFSFWEHATTVTHTILSDGKTIRLALDTPLEEFLVYELLVPLAFTSESVPVPGFSMDVIFDRTPPEITSVLALSINRLLVIFSEPIDRAFAMGLEQFQVDRRFPTRIEFTTNPNELILDFASPFQVDATYSLLYSGIVDLFGNFQEEGSFDFVFREQKTLAFKDIIINELMPAPRSGNTLPNVEYVELYNRTDEVLALEGLQWANSRRVTQIPAFVLPPKSYVLLTPRNQVHQFTAFGSVLGLTNWPALLNSADQVRLMDGNGRVLDSLSYTTANFGGSAFASGGYSLEIANPDILCDLPSNLRASTSPKRGTPGKTNAIFDLNPDRTLFVLERAIVLDSQRVSLTFSKILGDTGRMNIHITPSISIDHVSFGNSRTILEIQLDRPLEQGKPYQIEVDRLWDCTGRPLEETKNRAVIIWPFEALENEVVLNELLANPRTGTPRFVEIYNSSDKYLNLQDWKLANLNSAGEVANRRILFPEPFVIEPYEFLVFTTDAILLKQEYPKGKETRFVQVSSLPSYPISGGTVVLLNADETIAEFFTYHDRMHHRLLRDSRGVSLERLSAEVSSQDPANWTSAASSVGFASPGFKNSQSFLFESSELDIRIFPEIFVPEAPGEQGFTTITYQMEQAGMVGSIHIYGVDGRRVKEICQNAIWGLQGFYVWEGVDDFGRKVRPGYYIVFVEVFDLVGNLRQYKKTLAVGTRF